MQFYKNMNKKEIIKSVIGVGILTFLIVLGISASKTKDISKIESDRVQQEQLPVNINNQIEQQTQLPVENKKSAQKIEVVHFHATEQCVSCITVGKLALKTIKERFPEEYASGKIVFKDINGELPLNKDMVMKYKATGSSLFVNAITDGVDNIKENTTVWLKISNEQDFINYFEGELKNLLGKS